MSICFVPLTVSCCIVCGCEPDAMSLLQEYFVLARAYFAYPASLLFSSTCSRVCLLYFLQQFWLRIFSMLRLRLWVEWCVWLKTWQVSWWYVLDKMKGIHCKRVELWGVFALMRLEFDTVILEWILGIHVTLFHGGVGVFRDVHVLWVVVVYFVFLVLWWLDSCFWCELFSPFNAKAQITYDTFCTSM